jgi:hypothetical protein
LRRRGDGGLRERITEALFPPAALAELPHPRLDPQSYCAGMHGGRHLAALVAAALVAAAVIAAPSPSPTDGYVGIDMWEGFDKCATPASSTMDAWWNSTTWQVIGVYLGGSNLGCNPTNLTANWIKHQQNKGWSLLPIWFGRQMKFGTSSAGGCQTVSYWNNYISLDTSTAYGQGYDEAGAALAAARNLGMDTPQMPLIYDLEAYRGGSACRAAAKAFINGWDYYLSLPTAQTSGVYGSDCGSYLNDFAAIANPPDFIWFGNWNGNPSTFDAACISDSNWFPGAHRHKQYNGPHYETHGGIRLKIDSDCSYGPTYYPVDRLSGATPCK